jgi:hypothetical protein
MTSGSNLARTNPVAKKRGTVTAVRAGDFCLFPNGLGSSHFVGTMTDHRRRLRSGGNRTGRVFRNGMSIAMGKIQKSAIELAKLVRREVQEPKIRIGVFRRSGVEREGVRRCLGYSRIAKADRSGSPRAKRDLQSGRPLMIATITRLYNSHAEPPQS